MADFDKKTVKSMEEKDVENMFEEFALSYESIVSVKSHTDPITRKIKELELLPATGKTLADKAAGVRISRTIDEVLKSIGLEIVVVVRNNFDLDAYKRRVLDQRANFEVELVVNQDLADETLIAPSEKTYDRKVKLAIHAALKEKREKEAVAIAQTSGSTTRSKKFSSDPDDEEEARIREEIQMEYDQKFDDEENSYRAKVKAQNEAKKQLKKLIRDKERCTVLENILTGYKDAMIQLVTKVKNAVKNYPAIEKLLTTTVVINAVRVNNPLETNSLPGIVASLNIEYRKKTFASFANYLQDLLSWKASEEKSQNAPWECYTEIESIYAEWRENKLFQHMTEDQLFSAAFLHGLDSKTPFRKELIQEVNKFIRNKLMSEEEDENGEPVTVLNDKEQMPIFTFIKEYVRIEKQNRGFGKKEGGTSGTTGSDTKVGVKTTWNGHRSSRDQHKENNVEAAASAAANTVNEKKLFANEVLKTQGISCEDMKGKQHAYVAVKKQSQICDKCYPESGAATNKCSRPCYGVQCNKCGHYGHRAGVCMQGTHALTGDKVQH